MENNLTIIIITSLLFFASLFGIFKNMKDGFGPFNLKVYGLTIVIFVSSLVALSDLPSEKLTALYSILGAIAGYLFGLKKE